ncbi:hypothetical protein [Sodalis glossinidius]|uniref:hypothetical protein n=1 Tax=Sodalis glossinidius TaxID=63612 RepID=UPI003C784611
MPLTLAAIRIAQGCPGRPSIRRAFALKRLLSVGKETGGDDTGDRLAVVAKALQFSKQGLQTLAINHCG